eukprot:6150823-Amphidinium_carterae.5
MSHHQRTRKDKKGGRNKWDQGGKGNKDKKGAGKSNSLNAVEGKGEKETQPLEVCEFSGDVWELDA